MDASISSSSRPRYQRILLRADGSASIGMGHVVRSFVLARALLHLGIEVQVWGSSVRSGRSLAPSFGEVPIRERTNPGGGVDEIPEIRSFEPDLIIADGYHFSLAFFHGLEAIGLDYGVIDDNGETQAPKPRFVVNQNPSARSTYYGQRFPGSKLFLGLEYALIRKEVVDCFKSVSPEPGSLLVSFGGSDVLGLTRAVTEHLQVLHAPLRVVLGPHAVGAFRKTELSSGKDIVFDPQDFPLALALSEICILAAGSSLWEANVGARKTLAIITADNQVLPACEAKRSGIVQTIIDFRPEKAPEDWPNQLLSATRAMVHVEKPQRKVSVAGASRLAKSIRDV